MAVFGAGFCASGAWEPMILRFGAFPPKLDSHAHTSGFFKSDDPAQAIVAHTIDFFTPDLF